jgi:hypothetical protein
LRDPLALPSSLKNIGVSAFEACDSLEGILTITGNVETIGLSAFQGCQFTGLELQYANNLKTIGNYAFRNTNVNKSSGVLTGTLTIPSSVITIGEGAFYGNNFTTLTLPASGTINIGDSAFSYNDFTSLEISNSVKTIGPYAFSPLPLLISLTFLPDAAVYSIGDYAFREAPIQFGTSIDIKAGVTIGTDVLPLGVSFNQI